MARKNKSKNTNHLLFLVVFTVGLAVVLVVIYLLNIDTPTYSNNEPKITNALEDAGAKIDNIQNILKEGEVKGKISRVNDCHKAGRKLQTEPYYCGQYLKIFANDTSDKQIAEDFELISNGVSEEFDLKETTSINEVEGDGRFIKTYSLENTDLLRCEFNFYSRGENWYDKNNNNMYEVVIDCIGGEFEEPIYPVAE